VDYIASLLRLIAALNDAKVDYIVIGGAALNLHGLVRATEDVDLFVAPTSENIERLKIALRAVWNDPHIDEISHEDLCGDYPAVRYGPPEGNLYLDILTRLGEATRYDDLEAETIKVRDTAVRVATPMTLYRMKKDTVRAIDRADAQVLKDAFEIEDPDAD